MSNLSSSVHFLMNLLQNITMSLICQGFIQLVWREHSQIFSQFNWFWSFLWMELWVDHFSTHSFEISVNGNLIFHSFALRFLLPSSLKLRLNASSKHGDTLPSVFSINKKNLHFFGIVPFSPQGSLEPGSLDSEASALPLSYLAVDIRLSIVGLYICSISQYIPIWRPIKARWPLKGCDNNLNYEIIAKSPIFCMFLPAHIGSRSSGRWLWRL